MQTTRTRFSRRQFLKTAGAASLVASTAPAVVIPGRAQPKTLKIARMREFIPGYVRWFNEYAKTWGERNQTRVILDWIAMGDVRRYVKNEIADQQGHDLVHIPEGSTHEDFVIDHREIYEECEHRYGNAVDFAIQSSYNPKSKKFHRFCLVELADDFQKPAR